MAKTKKPRTTKPRTTKPSSSPKPLPELQVVRNCGACGAGKHVFLSKLRETTCDLCGKIQWV